MIRQLRPTHLLFCPDGHFFLLLLSTAIAATPSVSAATVCLPVTGCEGADVDSASITARILREAIGVDFKQVGFEIDFILENNELFLVTLFVGAHEVFFREVDGECIVVDVVLLCRLRATSIADMATLVLVATVCVQLVRRVEALSTEPALGVALEAGLVFRARLIVAGSLVLAQIDSREECVLVGEDFFVT